MGRLRPFWGNVSETPTPTTCLKSTAVHLQFVRQYAPHLYRRAFLASKLRRKGNAAVRLPFVRQYASHLYGNTFGEILGVGVTGTFLNFWQNLPQFYSIFAKLKLKHFSEFSNFCGNSLFHLVLPSLVVFPCFGLPLLLNPFEFSLKITHLERASAFRVLTLSLVSFGCL